MIVMDNYFVLNSDISVIRPMIISVKSWGYTDSDGEISNPVAIL